MNLHIFLFLSLMSLAISRDIVTWLAFTFGMLLGQVFMVTLQQYLARRK